VSDYILKIAKEGYNVKTAEDKDLIYSSEMATPKIAVNDVYTATSTAMVNISHGLGYLPTYLLFDGYGDGEWSTSVLNYDLDEYVDNSKVRVWMVNGHQLRYFFLYEPSVSGVTGITLEPDDYGLVISKPGYDVKTAKAHEQSFNSKLETFSIVDTISDTLYCDGVGDRTKTVAHGLGYAPAFLCKFSSNNSSYYWTGIRMEPAYFVFYTESPDPEYPPRANLDYWASVDDTNFYFNQSNGGFSALTETVSFTAYLFNQKLE
jgi:hypothetical protein